MTDVRDRRAAYCLPFLLVLLLSGRAFAGQADGTLLGAKTIQYAGDPAQRLDLVFVGDGFQADERDEFETKARLMVQHLFATSPFSALRFAFNVHLVFVASTDSGIDIPANCPDLPAGVLPQQRDTAMDTSYCMGAFRTIDTPDRDRVTFYSTATGLDPDFTVVLVNENIPGGSGDSGYPPFSPPVAFSSTGAGSQAILVHELAHAIADLADEYNYGMEDAYSGPPPEQPNLTVAQDLAFLPWADLVFSGDALDPPTPLPTQSHANCADPTLAPPTKPLDIVGTFEGAYYRRCQVFRPQYDCMMRQLDAPFCAVCRRALIRKIAPHLEFEVLEFQRLTVNHFDEKPPWNTSGEIAFYYLLQSPGWQTWGRVPGAGEISFDPGDTRALRARSLPLPAVSSGFPLSASVAVIEVDPNSYQVLDSPATRTLAGPGPVTYQEPDYRLTGELKPSSRLLVLLDTLFVRHDMDNAAPGDRGEIFIRYRISNGQDSREGRWPAAGWVAIGDGETRNIGRYAGSWTIPDASGVFSLQIEAVDIDGFQTESLGTHTFTFDAPSGFGANQIIHSENRPNYRITFSIVEV